MLDVALVQPFIEPEPRVKTEGNLCNRAGIPFEDVPFIREDSSNDLQRIRLSVSVLKDA